MILGILRLSAFSAVSVYVTWRTCNCKGTSLLSPRALSWGCHNWAWTTSTDLQPTKCDSFISDSKADGTLIFWSPVPVGIQTCLVCWRICVQITCSCMVSHAWNRRLSFTCGRDMCSWACSSFEVDFIRHFIGDSMAGSSGCLTWRKLQQAQEQHCPVLPRFKGVQGCVYLRSADVCGSHEHFQWCFNAGFQEARGLSKSKSIQVPAALRSYPKVFSPPQRHPAATF